MLDGMGAVAFFPKIKIFIAFCTSPSALACGTLALPVPSIPGNHLAGTVLLYCTRYQVPGLVQYSPHDGTCILYSSYININIYKVLGGPSLQKRGPLCCLSTGGEVP